MRKFITILLCLSMLFLSVAATGCANSGDRNNEKIDTTLDHLKGLDFEGAEVNIVYVEGGNGEFTKRSLGLDPDDDTGDSVDQAVLKRNSEVESMLQVTLVPQSGAEHFDGLTAAISSSLASSSGEYDIIAGYQYFDIGIASKGWLLNLNNLANYDADYLRLDEDYWSQSYNESLSYNENTYWVTGDIALRFLGGMYCTFVNGDLYEAILQKTYGHIYDLVREGKWTLDMLLEMMELVYKDSDGDTETSENDRLGFVLETSMDPIDGMAFGSQIQWTQRTEDGINLVLRNNRTISFGEKMSKILASRSFYAPAGDDSHNQMALFSSGNVMFTVASVFQAEVHLMEMDNYYVIPVPKLDENQAGYASGIHDGCTIFGIPYDAEDVAKSAATLEALAALSKKYVTPEYYDSALKYRYTRDNEAAEMIDIMHDAAYTDFAAAWSKDINDIAHFFRDHSSRLGRVSSILQANYSKWNSSLETLLVALETYGIE